MLRDKGVDCRVVETTDFNLLISEAKKDGRIILTSYYKFFNDKKVNYPRGLVPNGSPFNQFKSVVDYFHLD